MVESSDIIIPGTHPRQARATCNIEINGWQTFSTEAHIVNILHLITILHFVAYLLQLINSGYSMRAVIGNTKINRCGYVAVKLYL